MDKYTESHSFNVILYNCKKKKWGHSYKFQNNNIEQMKQNAE